MARGFALWTMWSSLISTTMYHRPALITRLRRFSGETHKQGKKDDVRTNAMFYYMLIPHASRIVLQI